MSDYHSSSNRQENCLPLSAAAGTVARVVLSAAIHCLENKYIGKIMTLGRNRRLYVTLIIETSHVTL